MYIKIFYALVLSLLLSSVAYADFDGNEKHTIKNVGVFTNSYTVDGTETDVDEVERLLLYVPDANEKWGTGKILRYVSYGLGFVGGFIVGYSAVSGSNYDAGDDYKTGLFIGGGIVLAAIIVNRVGASKRNGAIEIYNSESGKQKANFGDMSGNAFSAFNIQVAPTSQGGVGLAFNF